MRLLLAEDEKELSNALCAILKHHNYSVDAVYNGKDALEYGLAENYDAILLDIMMPKMNGIDVLKALRNDDRRPNPKPKRPFSKHMSVETPFQTRYFIVRTNTQNEIIEIDTSHIAAITSTNADSPFLFTDFCFDIHYFRKY